MNLTELIMKMMDLKKFAEDKMECFEPGTRSAIYYEGFADGVQNCLKHIGKLEIRTE